MPTKFNRIPTRHTRCTTTFNNKPTPREIMTSRKPILEQLRREDNYFGGLQLFQTLLLYDELNEYTTFMSYFQYQKLSSWRDYNCPTPTSDDSTSPALK